MILREQEKPHRIGFDFEKEALNDTLETYLREDCKSRLFEVNPLSEGELKQRQQQAHNQLDKAWVILQRIKPHLRKH